MKRIPSKGDTGLKQAFDRDISNNDEKAYSFFLVFLFFFFNPPQTSCGLPSNVMSEKVPQAPYNKKQK